MFDFSDPYTIMLWVGGLLLVALSVVFFILRSRRPEE